MAGAICLSASAKQPARTIPVDPDLRTGRLENGLTYYIRHNEEPKGQACFHFVQDSGSILEEEDERGLAHFLEHMCFNGTKHFPGNSMVKWLQGKGVKFGDDLNAFTSMDETVYSIDNVPVTEQNVIDSCLLIIHDWCCDLTFNPEEIDKERGVIMEEWRSHRGSMERMYDKILPEIYSDTCRYSDRMPIGDIKVLESFKPETLRNFWKKWSRPDLLCIVVVGDIDADQMVETVKARFSDLSPAPADAPKRTLAKVPSNGDTPVTAFAHDKDQTVPTVYLYKKQSIASKEDKTDEDYYWMLFIQRMMDMMINGRIQEKLSDPSCPWTDAAIGETEFFISKTMGSWMGVMASYPDQTEEGIADLYREMKRIELHGFTQAEYDDALAEYLSRLGKAAAEYDRTLSSTLCSVYDRNYLDNEPMMSAAQELELARNVSREVDLPFINFYCTLMPKADWTVIGLLPEGFDEPDVMKIIAEVDNEEIKAYEDKKPPMPLMTDIPPQGTSRKTDEVIYGYEKYVLGNGATVYVKDTDFNPNQIQIRAFSEGGTSLYGDEDIPETEDIETIFQLGGLGDLSVSELTRSIAGKQVSIAAEIGSHSEGVYGSSTTEDFETLLQLTNLYFTKHRADTNSFKVYVSRRLAQMEGERENDQSAINDTINKLAYCDHPRARKLSPEDVKGIDYGRVMEIAGERFADASDFSFIFTGSFNEETMMPLVERYIGSLPSSNGRNVERYVNRGCTIKEGRRESKFSRTMETPVAPAVRIYSCKAKYNLKQNMVHELMGKCLTTILEQEIREESGATYSIKARAMFNDRPEPILKLHTFYQTDPERIDEIEHRIDSLMVRFAQEGPSQEILDEVVQYKIKRYEENTKSNAWFSTLLREYIETGVDFGTDYLEVVKSIKPRDLARELRKLLRSGNEVRVTLVGSGEE